MCRPGPRLRNSRGRAEACREAEGQQGRSSLLPSQGGQGIRALGPTHWQPVPDEEAGFTSNVLRKRTAGPGERRKADSGRLASRGSVSRARRSLRPPRAWRGSVKTAKGSLSPGQPRSSRRFQTEEVYPLLGASA